MEIKVKICGLLNLEDVKAVNEVLPDYAGFVFAPSRRMITEETAKELRAALNPSILSVGVFVNEDKDKILRLCESKSIDLIQLHGDENIEYIQYLRNRLPNPIIKAVRVREVQDILNAEAYPCDYLLLDAYHEKEYGGSGTRFDWTVIPKLTNHFFLAGGINADNVLSAIEGYHPYCIDVSSGVETEGKKDLLKMKDLIAKIRSVR